MPATGTIWASGRKVSSPARQFGDRITQVAVDKLGARNRLRAMAETGCRRRFSVCEARRFNNRPVYQGLDALGVVHQPVEDAVGQRLDRPSFAPPPPKATACRRSQPRAQPARIWKADRGQTVHGRPASRKQPSMASADLATVKMREEIESTLTNHLISEKSPYLQQHAHNPVDWYRVGRSGVRKIARRRQADLSCPSAIPRATGATSWSASRLRTKSWRRS